MKLVIGAEIDGEVYEFFRPVRALLQEKFNFLFENEEYGAGLPKFHFIAIIRSSAAIVDYPEVYKYLSKTKKCDYRVAVSFDDFLNASNKERCTLICDAIGKAIQHLMLQNIDSVDANKIYLDFNAVRKQESW